MTGKQFEAWLKRLKMTKGRAAVEIGVTVDTMTTICQSVEVKRYYALALMAVATRLHIGDLQEISDSIGAIASEYPKINDK